MDSDLSNEGRLPSSNATVFKSSSWSGRAPNRPPERRMVTRWTVNPRLSSDLISVLMKLWHRRPR